MNSAERAILLVILGFTAFSAVMHARLPNDHNPALEWSEPARCVRVIDGDTIEIEGGVIVRLVGVEAFELRRGSRLDGEAEAAGISADEALARGALQAEDLRRRIEGKEIVLRYRLYPTDRYGRRLGELVEGE